MVSLEFFIDNPSGLTTALGVDPASNGNEYQEYLLWGKDGRRVGLTNLHLNVPQPAVALRACRGLYKGSLMYE